MGLFSRFFGRRSVQPLSISYGITVCNEAQELRGLLTALLTAIDAEDEIIVLRDITHAAAKVSRVLENFSGRIRVIEARLDNDFATFKNRLFAATECDYLFQIDADEVPSASLLANLKPYLRRHPRCDCFRVPRLNMVHGITEKQIAQWGWKMDANGYINFPDRQPRIARNNGKVRWRNKVHEVFTGYSKLKKMPARDFTYCILHAKTLHRQEQQNDLYDAIVAQTDDRGRQPAIEGS